MSSYNGRRAPNVSQFIANLNMVSSPQDMSLQQDGYNFEDDLAMFTNAEFFDFDLGETVDASLGNLDSVKESARSSDASSTLQNDQSALNLLDGNFQFPDFPGFQNLLGADTDPVIDPILQTATSNTHNVTATSSGHPSPATPSSALPAIAASPQSQIIPSNKRKAEAVPPTPVTFEEASRVAAEEDKRRRNTAASARFRVKKKQREQTLERTAKEMTEKVAQLESRIGQLETENKWLKNLITEKNGNRDDIADMWRRFTRDGGASSSSSSLLRSISERKDGVGTKAVASKK